MQFTISAASFLALVSAAMAQTAGFDAITTPAKAEVVPAGSSYVINWDYVSTYAGTVTIQLLEGATSTTLQLGPILASKSILSSHDNPHVVVHRGVRETVRGTTCLQLLPGGIDNSLGAFTWPVDSTLGDDATYGIKITFDGDATGATFQYSNPFSISKASAAVTPSAAAPATSSAPVAVNVGDEPESTLYSTAWITVTSCAATVTDCPARSTVVSSTLVPAASTPAVGGGSPEPSAATGVGAASPPAKPSAATGYGAAQPPAEPSVPATGVSASSPVVTSPPAPVYPAGNGTIGGSGAGGLGTVTLPKSATTTGSGSAATTSAVVTAGAGRVAVGGLAAAAGLFFAFFAL